VLNRVGKVGESIVRAISKGARINRAAALELVVVTSVEAGGAKAFHAWLQTQASLSRDWILSWESDGKADGSSHRSDYEEELHVVISFEGYDFLAAYLLLSNLC